MNFDLKLSGSKGVLSLHGDLTVVQAEELKDALIKGMAQTDCLTVTLEHVVNIDLSCLQVFCSAHRTFDSADKALTFSRQGLESFEPRLRMAGFYGEKSCDLKPSSACLWGGGAQ